MKKFQSFGVLTPEESEREKKHKSLARRAAAEGYVLLKNEGLLPLQNKNIALYGAGSRRTVKGGSGSGDVYERHSVTIEEGLKNAGFIFPTTLWMDRFEKKYQEDIAEWEAMVEEKIKGFSPVQSMKMFDVIHEYQKPNPACTPILEDELSDETDTAIYVLSRQAGEGGDRRYEKGDYLLSDVEEESLRLLSAHYKKLVLVLNCGSVIDLSILDQVRIDAVIFYAQGGMEGGNALADILTGKVNPCGKLTDTWAYHYDDYPCADTFGYRNGDVSQEDYREDIYVGYRYFDAFSIHPRFPFGFGLSYTTFSMGRKAVLVDGSKVTVDVSVKNTGKYAGREVVQLYLQKPQMVQGVEEKSLAAFAKTGCLQPGETELVTTTFDVCDLAVYDEEKEMFVLPQGEYGVLLGTHTGAVSPVAVLTLSEEVVVEQVSAVHPFARSYERMQPEQGKRVYEESLTRYAMQVDPRRRKEKTQANPYQKRVEELLRNLTISDRIRLVTGGGYSMKCYNNVMGAAGRTCTKLLKKGVPNIVMSDGPAGLNVVPCTAIAKDGTPRFPDGVLVDWRWGWIKKHEEMIKHLPGKYQKVYRYTTAWPSETLLAQSFDIDLLEEVGQAIGREMKEIGISIWLAPGLNIHRNPLCGRNFEYYSEDPLVSGKMAAAVTRGVQSVGDVGVSVKHFCCNNQEDNRMEMSSNVTQRALREIYLRAFRIAIEEGDPWTIMSCYNRVNGLHVCNNKELLTDVLRGEWGYQGLVMSDWTATNQCSHAKAINAGNDLIMPGDKSVWKALEQAKKEGLLQEDALQQSCERVLTLILKSETCKDFR